MNYHKYIKLGLLATAFMFAGTIFTSCEEDILVGSDDSNRFDNTEGAYGYVKNMSGARDLSTIEIFGNGTGKAQLYFELAQTATQAVDVKLKVDKAALDAYNAANKTSYEMYPEAMVSLGNGGATSVAANATQSAAVEVTVQAGGTAGTVYALPISAEVTTAGVAMSQNYKSYIYLVKPMGAIPSSDKGTGMKAICYIEVNDENILNAGEYMMKSTGKPFFDVVNIFAANINYNKETGRVYINCNDNTAFVLKNADKFIRPLQAKGIKVCLTILGNHDEAGIANLSKESAASLAQELKIYVDTYGLDGIDFDDEYSIYQENPAYTPSPGFEKPSKAASARLMYECRKVMPDKILSFYDWNNYVPTGNVEDGQPVGNIVDYMYYGYYGYWKQNGENEISGLGKAKYCPYAINLNYDDAYVGGYDPALLEKVRTDGYGIQMFYNLKPRDNDYSAAFNHFGNTLFDDDVEWSGRVYGKTDAQGEVSVPSYASYIGTWTLASEKSLLKYDYQGYPMWIFGKSVEYTIRIEEKVANESFLVYGWGVDSEFSNAHPFVMNYNKHGRLEVNLPQTLTDGSEEWQLVPRWSSTNAQGTQTPEFSDRSTAPAFSGWITSSGTFKIKGTKSNLKSIGFMTPVKVANGKIVDAKGGIDQTSAYGPFTLTRK